MSSALQPRRLLSGIRQPQKNFRTLRDRRIPMTDKHFTNLISTLFALLVLCLAPSSLLAQAENGELAGTVTDPSGAVVPEAGLTLTNTGTNAERTTKSTSNGAYAFHSVPAGIYELSGQSTGFQPFKQRVEITVGGHATLDVQLPLPGPHQPF